MRSAASGASIWTPSMVCVPNAVHARGVDGAGDVGRDDVRGFGRSLVRRARVGRGGGEGVVRVGELAGVLGVRGDGAAGVTRDPGTRRREGEEPTRGTRDAPLRAAHDRRESERARGGNSRARRRPCPGRRAR